MLANLRFALHLLRKSPGLTAIAISSLALGIGATTAAFSAFDAMLLRPLPAVHAPAELLAVLSIHGKEEGFYPLSWANYLDYAGHSEIFSELAAAAACDLNLVSGGAAERISGLAVSNNYFVTLGLKPAYGRLFSPSEEVAPIAILGHALWKRRFGADPGVVGSVITVNGKSMTIVGIAPEGFWGTDLSTPREIWLPLKVYSEIASGILVPFSGQHDRKQEWLSVLGRLAPGVTSEQAQSAFNTIAKNLATVYPEVNKGYGVRLLPIAELVLGQGMRPVILEFTARLMAVMVLVLAVASLNLGGLLLARALTRRQEIAIRLSLGASRVQLMWQLIIEGLVLGLLGAAAGIVLAKASLPLFARIALPASIVVRDFKISGLALWFALLVSLASCLVGTLAPMLQALRTKLVPTLRGEVPHGRHRLRFGLREILVSLQVALAFLALIASGLMLRTLMNLSAIDPGFDPTRVLVFSIDLSQADYQGARAFSFYKDLLNNIRSLPEVEEASLASALPVMGSALQVELTVTPEDSPSSSADDLASLPAVHHAMIGNRYFQTVGIKILQGRGFGPEEEVSRIGAVIVNETAARRLWPGRNPIGRRLRLVQSETPFEVIGVVADTTYANLKEKAVPVLYLAHSQYDKSFIGSLLAPGMTILMRTSGEPWKVLPAVHSTVRSIDPLLPVFGTKTLENILASTIGVERQATALYCSLALLAMALAILGIYGALTHAVAARTREIAIRVGCGASPRAVWALVLRRSTLLFIGGLLIGLAVAAPASQIVASQIYGVKKDDPITWLLTPLVLLAAVLLASIAPARRATRIDPVTILRHE